MRPQGERLMRPRPKPPKHKKYQDNLKKNCMIQIPRGAIFQFLQN